jgi:hypothetical protein
VFELFRGSGRKLQEQVQRLTHELDQLRVDVINRLQQVEEECARIQFERMLRGIHGAVDLAFASAYRLRLLLGRAFVRWLRLCRAARRQA